jgi:hypothetical protein
MFELRSKIDGSLKTLTRWEAISIVDGLGNKIDGMLLIHYISLCEDAELDLPKIDSRLRWKKIPFKTSL